MSDETENMQRLRLWASEKGMVLWRNNNGACLDDTGRMIRYGLGNDSAKLNKVWKSSDLIGICPVKILPEHVGRTIGMFFAVEVKRTSWRGIENERDKSQGNFLTDVTRMGGFGAFANTVESIEQGGIPYVTTPIKPRTSS